MYGQWQTSLPSRFIEELPAAHIEIESAQGLYSGRPNRGWGESEPSDTGYYTSSGDKYGPGWERAKTWRAEQSATQYHRKPSQKTTPGRSSKPKVEPVSDFAVGERVFHDKFGYGMIEDVEGNKLLVEFDKAGSKRVIDSFVSLA